MKVWKWDVEDLIGEDNEEGDDEVDER